jgi:hypothetical protein
MSLENLTWNEDALQRLQEAPFFIRKFAKKKVEKAAIAHGKKIITIEFVEMIRKQNA